MEYLENVFSYVAQAVDILGASTWYQLAMLAALTVMFFLAMFLCLWPHYNDGILGKLALFSVALGCLIIVMEYLLGEYDYRFSRANVMIMCGVAFFLLRHVIIRIQSCKAALKFRGRLSRSTDRKASP